MSFSSDIIYLHPDQITINRSNRQRTDIDTTDLIDSIRENGVINPIIVRPFHPRPLPGEGKTVPLEIKPLETTYLLVAGERRLESCRELGLNIPCRLFSSLNTIDAQIIETEENLKRTNLSWRDEAKAIAHIHNLYMTSNIKQTIDQTAKSLSLSKSHITNCLTIAKYQDLKLLDSASSIAQAISLLNRFHLHQQQTISSFIANNPLPNYLIEDIKPPKKIIDTSELIIGWDAESTPEGGEVIAKLNSDPFDSTPLTISPEPLPPQHIINSTFRTWVGRSEPIKFNFIHLDINEDFFDNNISTFTKLLEPEALIMIWYTDLDQQENIIQKTFYLDLNPIISQPLIWFQSDIKEYESALIFRYKSTTKLNLHPYIYPAPKPQISTDKKPESMLRFFFNKLITKDTKFFDPECGNGSSLRAADALGISSILGLSSDPKLCSHGNELIQRDRLLRRKF